MTGSKECSIISQEVHLFITEQEAKGRLRSAEELFASLRPSLSIEPSAPAKTVSVQDPINQVEEQDDEVEAYASEVDRLLMEESESNFNLENSLRDGPDRKPGRPIRGMGLNNDARAAIALTGELLSSQRRGASMFGVSQGLVSANQRGYNSQNDAAAGLQKNGDLVKKLERNREIVIDKATAKMLKCLNLLDDDKLAAIGKATDLSRVAVDMSRIVEKATPKEKDSEGSVHFHIYRPPQVEEDHYQTIDVTPEPSDVRE